MRWSKIKTGHWISPLPFSLSAEDSLACSFRNCRHWSCYTIWRHNISDQPAFDRCDCFSFTLSWFGFLGLLAICGKRATQPQQDRCLSILDMSAPLVLKEYCNPKMSLLLARTLTILVHANIDNTLAPLSSSCMLVLHALAQTSTWTFAAKLSLDLPCSGHHVRCPEWGVEFGTGLNLILQIVTNDLKAATGLGWQECQWVWGANKCHASKEERSACCHGLVLSRWQTSLYLSATSL